jgi:hypothetical protein
MSWQRQAGRAVIAHTLIDYHYKYFVCILLHWNARFSFYMLQFHSCCMFESCFDDVLRLVGAFWQK